LVENLGKIRPSLWLVNKFNKARRLCRFRIRIWNRRRVIRCTTWTVVI